MMKIDLSNHGEYLYSSLENSYNNIIDRVEKAVASRASDGSCERKPVTFIAVSKTHSVDAIEQLYHLGQRHFGENYVQELVEKAKDLESRGCHGVFWHFIGHLQSNKIKRLIPHVSCIHTIDALPLALEISKHWINYVRAETNTPQLPVFLQVNMDAEQSKNGFSPAELLKKADELSQVTALSYQGLMCIPSTQLESRASAFIRLQELEQRMRPLTHGGLSMGMSEDFEDAIAAGATHVRLGTILFGPRWQG